MKLFLAILTVALMAQVSFAAPVQRSKRDAAEPRGTFAIIDDILADQMPKWSAIAKELPSTDGFNKYREYIDDIVKYYNTKNGHMLCVLKNIQILDHMKQFKEKLAEDNTEESKQVLAKIDALESDETKNMKLKELVAEMLASSDSAEEEVLETC